MCAKFESNTFLQAAAHAHNRKADVEVAGLSNPLLTFLSMGIMSC